MSTAVSRGQSRISQLSVTVTRQLQRVVTGTGRLIGPEGGKEGTFGKLSGRQAEGEGRWGLIAPWKVFSPLGVASWDHPPKQTVCVCYWICVCVDKPVE